MAKNISGSQAGTPGYQAAEDYFNDPVNAKVADSFHSEHDIGKIAQMIEKLKFLADNAGGGTTIKKAVVDFSAYSATPVRTNFPLNSIASGLDWSVEYNLKASSVANKLEFIYPRGKVTKNPSIVGDYLGQSAIHWFSSNMTKFYNGSRWVDVTFRNIEDINTAPNVISHQIVWETNDPAGAFPYPSEILIEVGTDGVNDYIDITFNEDTGVGSYSVDSPRAAFELVVSY